MRVTMVTDLDVRAFGENAYSKKTPQERFTDLVVRDIVDLTQSAQRRIEQMTSSLLFTGEFSYRLDSGETETLDYGTVTPIVPATKWDATNSDPLGDLQTAVNQIVASSGLMPDTLVLGSNVMSVFLSHPQVIDVLNKLNVSLGAIQPSKPVLGTSQFVGRVYRPYLDLYGYAESYELEETPGTLKPMVPEDSALLGCSSSQATTSFGSITQTEADGQIATYTDVKFVPRQLSEPRQGIPRAANRDPAMPDPVRPLELGGHQPVNLRGKNSHTMQAFTSPVSNRTGSLIGVEPMSLVTYSLTLDPAQGTLPAGTFIGANGAKAATVAGVFGVLAHDTTTHATEQTGATIYTSGSFLEARVKAANSGLTIDAAAIDSLRAKNIYLERSVPISMTIPPAAVVLEGEEQPAAAGETEEERRRREEGERPVASAESLERRRREEDATRLAAAEEERRRRGQR